MLVVKNRPGWVGTRDLHRTLLTLEGGNGRTGRQTVVRKPATSAKCSKWIVVILENDCEGLRMFCWSASRGTLSRSYALSACLCSAMVV